MGVIHYEWANTRISVSFQVSHGPIGQDFTWSEEMSEWLYQNQAASVYEAVKLQQAPSQPRVFWILEEDLCLCFYCQESLDT